MTERSEPRPTKLRVGLHRVLGRDDAPWHLTIMDDTAGVGVADVRLTDLDFAALMSNRDPVSEGHVYDTFDMVGCVREVKTIIVPVERKKSGNLPDVAGLFDEAERTNPGWKAMRESHLNMHRLGPSGYKVHIERHLPFASDA